MFRVACLGKPKWGAAGPGARSREPGVGSRGPGRAGAQGRSCVRGRRWRLCIQGCLWASCSRGRRWRSRSVGVDPVGARGRSQCGCLGQATFAGGSQGHLQHPLVLTNLWTGQTIQGGTLLGLGVLEHRGSGVPGDWLAFNGIFLAAN